MIGLESLRFGESRNDGWSEILNKEKEKVVGFVRSYPNFRNLEVVDCKYIVND